PGRFRCGNARRRRGRRDAVRGRRRARRGVAPCGVSPPYFDRPHGSARSDISGRVQARRSTLLPLGRQQLRPKVSARGAMLVRVRRTLRCFPRGVSRLRPSTVARRRGAAGGGNERGAARARCHRAPDALRALDPRALARLKLRFEPSVTLIKSAWPVDAIWRANQPGADGVVDLGAGAVRIEVRRLREDVVFRALPPGRFAFRAAVAAGRSLEDAVEGALDAEPGFDLAVEIRALIDERVLAA